MTFTAVNSVTDSGYNFARLPALRLRNRAPRCRPRELWDLLALLPACSRFRKCGFLECGMQIADCGLRIGRSRLGAKRSCIVAASLCEAPCSESICVGCDAAQRSGYRIGQRIAPANTSVGFKATRRAQWHRLSIEKIAAEREEIAAGDGAPNSVQNSPVGSTPRPMKFIYFFMLLIWADSRMPGC